MNKKYRVILNSWLDLEFCAEWEINFSFKKFDEIELEERLLEIEEN